MAQVLKYSIGSQQKDREFIFTDMDFDYIRDLALQQTGIALTEAKRELVYSRLSRRLRQLKINSFRQYCELLQNGQNQEEIIQFTNAITTNLTSFFRESHHFKFLNDNVLKKFGMRENLKRKLRIWSAGCSTGEEPYSIAMTVRDSNKIPGFIDSKILATDLDSSVLETAQNGVYAREKLKSLAPHKEKRWFKRVARGNHDFMQVKSELQEIISFRKLNLMHDWPMKGKFDAIFCRNVLIYFDKATQSGLVNRFADILEDDGYLFLGHSESLFKVTERFRLAGQTVYQKIK